MVSIKRFIFVLSVLFVFCGTDCVYARNETVTKPIQECEGYSESRTMCERTLPNGTKQTGNGWCKCSGGRLSGGCLLPEYTYTDRMLSTNGGNKCRTCTVPGVTKGCGGMADMVVDETPRCGEWEACPDNPSFPDEPFKPVKECNSGDKQYRPSGDCNTEENKCCSNGRWSGYGKECSSSSLCFAGSQCWDGSKCQNKGIISRNCSGNVSGASGGTQTRTATCSSGSGWVYGAWSGTCTCNSGMRWNGSMCVSGGIVLPKGCNMVGVSCTDCVGRAGRYINDATNKCCCSANTIGGRQCCLVNLTQL